MKKIITILLLLVGALVLTSDGQSHDNHYDAGDTVTYTDKYTIIQDQGRVVIADIQTEHKRYVVIKGGKEAVIKFQHGGEKHFVKIGPFIVDKYTGERIVGVKGKYYADKRASVFVIFDGKLKAIYSFIWLKDYRVSVSLDQEITDNISDNLETIIDAQVDKEIEKAKEVITQQLEQKDGSIEDQIEFYTNIEDVLNNNLADVGGSIDLQLSIDDAISQTLGSDPSNNGYTLYFPSGRVETESSLKHLDDREAFFNSLSDEDLTYLERLFELGLE